SRFGTTVQPPRGSKWKEYPTTGFVEITSTRNQLEVLGFSLPRFSLPYSLSVDYRTEETRNSSRALPLHRTLLPWANAKAELGKPVALAPPKELDGGSWARGRQVYFSEPAACFKCHSVH